MDTPGLCYATGNKGMIYETCACPDARRAALVAQLDEEDRQALRVGKAVLGMPGESSVYRYTDEKRGWLVCRYRWHDNQYEQAVALPAALVAAGLMEETDAEQG